MMHQLKYAVRALEKAHREAFDAYHNHNFEGKKGEVWDAEHNVWNACRDLLEVHLSRLWERDSMNVVMVERDDSATPHLVFETRQAAVDYCEKESDEHNYYFVQEVETVNK